MTQVTDNKRASRFELAVEGHTAFADYRRKDGQLIITHVETPAKLRGRGIGSQLMQGVVELARAEGAVIVPLCSFAADYMARQE